MSLWQTCSENIPEKGKPIRFMLRADAVVHEGRLLRYGDATYFQDDKTEAIYRPAEVLAWIYDDSDNNQEANADDRIDCCEKFPERSVITTDEVRSWECACRSAHTDNAAAKGNSACNENQEAKADAGKLDPTLVPSEFIWAAAAIRRYGTKKYGSPDNWKRVSVERYRSAAYRHWLRYLADPHGVDEESGLPHLWHWICNAAFIAELEKDFLKKYYNYEADKEE